MKPLDSDLARLLRYIALVIAIIASIVGAVLAPLVPGTSRVGHGDFVFRVLPFMVAIPALLLAAWLRRQEALDAAYEGQINKSLLFHFGIYSLFSIASCLLATVLMSA